VLTEPIRALTVAQSETSVTRQPEFCLANEKSRVPDTFQLSAILPCSTFFAFQFFNNLRVFNAHEYPDSPRLHHSFALI
jgi:hypothetical protein